MKRILALLLLFTGIRMEAQDADSIWQRSLVKFEQENYHGAIEDMDVLLKMVPGLSSALFNRGIAKLNLGNREDACIDLMATGKDTPIENKQFIDFLCDENKIRDLLIKQFYNKVKVYPEKGYRPYYTRADTLRGSLRPERTCYDVFFYDLTVRIIPKGKQIKGQNTIRFHVLQPTRRIQVDLFRQFAIADIQWNGKTLNYTREFNSIFVNFPYVLQPGDESITIRYKGKPGEAPNPPWDGGFVWERDKNKDLWLGVACEQLGASSWWPTKDHMGDKPDSMLINLQIPKGYQAVSNGNLRAVTPSGKDYEQFSWFVGYPISNYNVTFYVGRYVSFTDMVITGRDTVRLDYNVLSYNLDTAKKHFRQTRDVIDFYNRAFGIYPFRRDGFSLVESPYEGMEHQSAIAYGNGYSNNTENAYRNKAYDYIIVHEAAHEWWGNSVTVSDMADIWIHEGFATYAEYMFMEDRFGMDEYLAELLNKSQYIFNIWPMVQNRDVNENSFAGNDAYNKGAMMLHCLRCCINNDSLFFSIIREFNIQNRYHTVTSNDFIRFVNEQTGQDYTSFFDKFLMETSIPVLEYTYLVDNDQLKIRFRWSGVKDGFTMPFGIETDKKKSVRLVGTAAWQEIKLPETSWFNFYNLIKGYEGCPHNSFTYFSTSCLN